MRNLILWAMVILPVSVMAALPAGVHPDSQTWRKTQDGNDYVIQMLSVKDTKYFPPAKDIKAIKATSSGRDLVHHVKVVKGTTWHTMLWGPFSSSKEAQAIYAKLPSHLNKAKPWARRISSLEKPIATSTKPAAAVKPKPKPVPVTAPKPKPTAPVRRTTTTSKFPKYVPQKGLKLPPEQNFEAYKDPYETVAVDESNFDSAMASQGTYPYVKVSFGELAMETDRLSDSLAAQGIVADLNDEFTGDLYEIALGLDLGYYLGVELGYVDASDLEPDSTAPNATVANTIHAVAPYGFTALKASALFKLPIHGSIKRQWQPYAQVGMMDWEVEKAPIKDTSGIVLSPKQKLEDKDMFYALGLDYKINKYVAVGAKYTVYDLEDDSGAVTADLTWRWEGRN